MPTSMRVIVGALTMLPALVSQGGGRDPRLPEKVRLRCVNTLSEIGETDFARGVKPVAQSSAA